MISLASLAFLASTSALAASSPIFHTCHLADTNLPNGSQISYYVPMRDGVRIAVDVLLPGRAATTTVPAVLEMTRYWRSTEGSGPTEEQQRFIHHGYAVVTGDVRGTGASSGTWPYHRSRPETLDFGELIAWVAKQPWSNGRIVGYGVSYSANTADWMPERQNPALKAVDSRFPDYDPYADLYFPGGIANRWMIETWGSGVRQLDLNERVDASGRSLPGIKAEDICFFDHFVNSADAPPLWPKKLLAYYTLGAEQWKSTAVWPLPQTKQTKWYFADQKRLTASLRPYRSIP
jgi:predicted acyl esterase